MLGGAAVSVPKWVEILGFYGGNSLAEKFGYNLGFYEKQIDLYCQKRISDFAKELPGAIYIKADIIHYQKNGEHSQWAKENFSENILKYIEESVEKWKYLRDEL